MLKICQNWWTISFSIEFKVLNRVENKKSSKTLYSCILHVNYNNYNNFLAWSDRFWKCSYIFCWKILCMSYFQAPLWPIFQFLRKILLYKNCYIASRYERTCFCRIPCFKNDWFLKYSLVHLCCFFMPNPLNFWGKTRCKSQIQGQI